ERVGIDPEKGGQYPMIGGSAAGGSQEHTTGLWPVDSNCSSNIDGLFSAGDSCCTWMWGAIIQGPPPGLSPAAVTGKRAGAGASRYARDIDVIKLTDNDTSVFREHAFGYLRRRSGFSPRWVIQLLQNYMMPYYVLHIKKADRLNATLELVGFLRDHMVPRMHSTCTHELRLAHEAENMTINAEMILRSSLFRAESRGWHFREDFPSERDEEWLAWSLLWRDENGKMCIRKEPVPKEWRPVAGTAYPPRWLAWEHPHNINSNSR
ncbi:MAG: FAD-binding protein, partial [Deltaproteobacteria bacterium]|nr:FAD-binding protein [Deltaproteobacteria bacterium]